jgi:hypothetical protein
MGCKRFSVLLTAFTASTYTLRLRASLFTCPLPGTPLRVRTDVRVELEGYLCRYTILKSLQFAYGGSETVRFQDG